MESLFTDACDPNDQCTVENVDITCGATGRRRRRSVDEEKHRNRLQRSPHRAEREEMKWNTMQSRHDERLASSQTRQRRNTLDWEVFISFDFSINVNYQEVGIDSYAATVDSENRMVVLAEDFFTKLSNGTIRPLNVSGLEMQLDESSPTYGYAEITCEPGYIANNNDYVCGKYK